MSEVTRRVPVPTVHGRRSAGSGDWHEPGEESSSDDLVFPPVSRASRRGDETPVAGVPTVRRVGWQLQALGALL